MANVSAAMVKELRERTGLGMMECKKALTAADGDIEQLRDQSCGFALNDGARVLPEGRELWSAEPSA